MRKHCAVFALVVLAVLPLSCSVYPETTKRQYFDEGNRYLAEKEDSEAVLQYRNGRHQDDEFAEARLKLTEAYLASDCRNALRKSVRAADLRS